MYIKKKEQVLGITLKSYIDNIDAIRDYLHENTQFCAIPMFIHCVDLLISQKGKK